MKQYRETYTPRIPTYIKYGTFAVFVITLIYIICIYYEYGFFTPSFFDNNKKEYLRSITHAYPPPLVNFMDPPNVFNQKYNIDEII